jgi:outer membrane protein assembly factor BamB
MKQPSSTPADRFGVSMPQQRLVVSSEEGTVALLNTRTGAVIWKVASGREVSTCSSGDEQFFVAFGCRRSLISGPGHHRETTEELHRRHAQIHAEPSWIEARRTQDGALLWRFADWNLIGCLAMHASPEVVVVASTSAYGDQAMYAFARSDGRRLWSYPTRSNYFHVQFDRCYLYGLGPKGGPRILDILTGEPVEVLDEGDTFPDHPYWISSPRGQVVLEQRWHQNTTSVRVLNPSTGVLVHEWPVPGSVRAVSDTGTLYCAGASVEDRGITAIRVQDGVALWQVSDVLVWQCAANDAALYSTKLDAGIGYVYAHDAQTGQPLWDWHTPDSVPSLLSLWGSRIPWMLTDSARRIAATTAATLRQPARDMWIGLRQEMSYGQWRKPYGLHGAVNAMWLLASQESAFLGTRLGVVALRASDGKLLWHALPTVDVSFFPPTVS